MSSRYGVHLRLCRGFVPARAGTPIVIKEVVGAALAARWYIVLGAALLLSVSGLRAAEPTVDDIMARMEKAEANIQAVSFEFTQEIAYTVTREKQKNAGEVIFQKPANLYVKQKNPLEQIIISNGKKVWIYTPSYRQVLVDNWKKWMGSSLAPASLLNFGQNYRDLKSKYIFSFVGTEQGKYVLLLTPRSKEVWQLKLWIDADLLFPAKAALFGDSVTITTETLNYRLNPPIDKKLFIFQAPSGVDVLNVP